ncbi:hypothetical protein [Dyella japonica]|uniref:Uncharacterized protein n=1 Tax=Dyella japonica DSM 16301 TaxID=1440762 RepID=A0A0G9H7H5_9GAMM|nr:hypothetical protein [Dyella japonica]KLD65436.1 hypothetical protein Y882_02650 [Dyella japonica DSM 16301]
MKQIAIYIVVAIALIAVGFGAGWHCKGVSVTAGQVTEAKAEVQDVVQQFQDQGAEQFAYLKVQQHQTLTLAADQGAIRATAEATKQEIQHATFHPASAPAAACPEPLRSPEFVRLYKQAARGNPAVAGSTAAR